MAVFLSLVGLGIAVEYALKPFALAYVQMVTEGATAKPMKPCVITSGVSPLRLGNLDWLVC